MIKNLLLCLALIGCATPKDEAPVFEAPSPVIHEALTLTQSSTKLVRISFNQNYFESQGVGGFHVTWNGVYQGVFLTVDKLDLPATGTMSLVLDYIDRDGMKINKKTAYNLRTRQ